MAGRASGIATQVNPIDEDAWDREELQERNASRAAEYQQRWQEHLTKDQRRAQARAAEDAAIDQVLGEAVAQGIVPDQASLLAMSPRDLMNVAMHAAAASGMWTLAQKWAADLAPYVHPRLASVAQTGDNSDTARSDAALAEEIAEIEERARAAAGERDELKPAAAQRSSATGRVEAGAVGPRVPVEPDSLGGTGKAAIRRNTGTAPPSAVH